MVFFQDLLLGEGMDMDMDERLGPRDHPQSPPRIFRYVQGDKHGQSLRIF